MFVHVHVYVCMIIISPHLLRHWLHLKHVHVLVRVCTRHHTVASSSGVAADGAAHRARKLMRYNQPQLRAQQKKKKNKAPKK